MGKKKTKFGVDISQTHERKTVERRFTWVVVAHQSLVQVYEYEEKGEELRFVHEFFFPQGNKKSSLLVTDRPGRSFDSWPRDFGGKRIGQRHSLGSSETLEDQKISFLNWRIAYWLEKSRANRQFDHLVLVMPPRLLGRLKSRLSEQTEKLISEEFEKDYTWLTRPQLEDCVLALLKQKEEASHVELASSA